MSQLDTLKKQLDAAFAAQDFAKMRKISAEMESLVSESSKVEEIKASIAECETLEALKKAIKDAGKALGVSTTKATRAPRAPSEKGVSAALKAQIVEYFGTLTSSVNVSRADIIKALSLEENRHQTATTVLGELVEAGVLKAEGLARGRTYSKV